MAVVGLVLYGGFALGAAGQSPPVFTAPAPVAEKAPAAQVPAPQAGEVYLFPGAAEVLKLARAKIDDDTIVAFIKSSKTGYSLTANEVVYLREQKVSERVVTAMLDQRPPVSQTWAAYTASQKADAQSCTTTTYAQPAPTSTYPAPAYGYYDSYRYRCGDFWRSFLPAISLSFGFGHGHHGGYYGVGFHGGGYHH